MAYKTNDPCEIPAPDVLQVPARMLNEWTYCPRLAVLEWVHGEWAENADTLKGRRTHKASDRGAAPALPDPEHLVETPERWTTRRLLLGSDTLGMTARIDLLEASDGEVTPVEIKKGRRPDVEHGAYPPERVQVCVQCLLLREQGYRCDRGYLWFAASREKVVVDIDEALIELTMAAVSGLQSAAQTGELPPPLEDSPRCTRCSLLPICLPDEVTACRGGTLPSTPPPALTPALPLYVQTPGAWVGKSGATLKIKLEGAVKQEIAMDEVSELILAGPCNLSTPAMHELLRRGTPVTWMSSGFWYLGTTGTQGPNSAIARTAHYRAAADGAARLRFARELIAAKITNQRTQLRRGWRGDSDARDSLLRALKRSADNARQADSEAALRGIEGDAAARYFRSFTQMFTDGVREQAAFSFERRNRRPPADPVNACLSLCYALLTRCWSTAVSGVGLDPWKGLWHADRPGRPALALDMIEPWRPIIADSAVLTAFNNGELKPDDFMQTATGCNLSDTGRKRLIATFERRLDQEVRHPVFGYTLSLRRMLHVQARLLVRHLLGEIPDYPHYLPR